LKFTEFNLHPSLQEGIESLGFENATPIQIQAIPVILEGRDLIGSAQTGTGKTAAFLIPIIQQILTHKSGKSIQAMVIVPTRELAMQIDQQMEGIAYFTGLSSMAIYGGGDGTTFTQEKQALTEGADMVICTPGRMIAHLNQEYAKTDGLKFLVLDEADRMLDMGFHEDIEKIINYLPKERQSLMFSATMPREIRGLARKILKDPFEINIAVSKPAERILQLAYVVYDAQKIPLITFILKNNKGKNVLVFCSTKNSTKELSRALNIAGMKVSEIHSDLDQKMREEVMLKFRNKQINILVATDILSRGIDVEDIDLIINYDAPNDGEDYIHRIGRTARAEAEGVAITLINEKDQGKFEQIEKLLEKSIHKAVVPGHLGETPVYDPKSNKQKHFKRKPQKGQKPFRKK